MYHHRVRITHPKKAFHDGKPRQHEQARPTRARPHDRRATAVLKVSAIPQPGGEGCLSEGVSLSSMPHLLQCDDIPSPVASKEFVHGWMIEEGKGDHERGLEKKTISLFTFWYVLDDK